MLADHEHSVFSGFRKFDPEKIQEMAIFFAKHTRDLSGTKLMKLFFYSDFYHFKNIHSRNLEGLLEKEELDTLYAVQPY